MSKLLIIELPDLEFWTVTQPTDALGKLMGGVVPGDARIALHLTHGDVTVDVLRVLHANEPTGPGER